MDRSDRAEGVLLGLACGDALGRPVEFRSAEQIAAEHGELREMVGYGTHGQPAGTITDDTEQALCIARSLVECDEFDPGDIAERFVAWYDSGPFDIGLMTADALRKIDGGASWKRAGRDVWEDRPEGTNAGNGSVMRCAPLAIAFADDTERLQVVSRRSSMITHADPRCTHGCAVLNLTIAALLDGDDQPLVTALDMLSPDASMSLRRTLEPVPDDIDPAELSNSGFVIHTLQSALYHALSAEDAESAIVNAVAMGGDTDTIGAVAGAVAGARFGATGLPERWTNAIDETDELRQLARELSVGSFSGDRASADRKPRRPKRTLSIHGREVGRSTSISASEFTRPNIGHRPDPVPTQLLDKPTWQFTAEDAAVFDWERRAYLASKVDGVAPPYQQSSIRVPEYSLVKTFKGLPTQDKERIHHFNRMATEALSRAEEALMDVRTPIREDEIESRPIPPVGQITSVTRQAVGTVNEARKQVEGRPENALEAAGVVTELRDDAFVLVDLLSWGLVEFPELAALRVQATTMLGEVQLALSSLHAVVVRHPELDAQSWDESTATGYLLGM